MNIILFDIHTIFFIHVIFNIQYSEQYLFVGVVIFLMFSEV